MQIAVIGLGKMGGNIARKLLQEGHEIVASNRSPEPITALQKEFPNVVTIENLQELKNVLRPPRVVWLMLPAGEVTETMLQEVEKIVEPNDIVIDGGNAHFKDTEKRYNNLKLKSIRFLGIGVSGGIIAAKTGYPLMVGGDRTAYEAITPLLDSLVRPHGGHEYFGEGGAGHYVKMIHNGIEYGIMQSLGEGFDVLSSAPYSLDMLKVAQLWQKGTLVSGFMLDRVVDSLVKDPKLEQIVGEIGMASREAFWTIDQAKEQGVPVEIIERSLEYRQRSKTDTTIQKSFTARMVAALRNAFGGHEVKKK